MATMKLTITLDEDHVEEIRRLVAASKAASVSGFVQHAVRMALREVAGWHELLDAGLAASGGPMTKRERAWADRLLARRSPSQASRRPRVA